MSSATKRACDNTCETSTLFSSSWHFLQHASLVLVLSSVTVSGFHSSTAFQGCIQQAHRVWMCV